MGRRRGAGAVTESTADLLQTLSKPFLNWAGKADRHLIDVPTVPLLVHARHATQAILDGIRHRKAKGVTLDLFGDGGLAVTDKQDAYEHKGPWQNRMVLGDSLQIMNSMLEFEGFVCAWLYALNRQGQLAALRTTVHSLRPDTGQALPALSFTSVEGRPVNLAEFQGKPIIVNLWATWRPPCVREMPELHQAQLDHPDVNFVYLNQGEPAEKVRAWLQAQPQPMRKVLMDANRQAAAAFKQGAPPATLFVDVEGRLVGTRIGELSAATLTERLQALAK